MILAFIGNATTASTLAARFGAAHVSRVRGDVHATLHARAPSEATADGARLGHSPLPHVTFSLTADATLTITRGGFGGRPAYVRRRHGIVLASTDLGWLSSACVALDMPMTLDADGLAARAAHLPGGDASTIYRDISEVPAGTRASLSVDELRSTRLMPPPRGSSIATAHDLRELLSAAVARALGPGRNGVLTGGGLDSSALLVLARQLGREVNAYAIDHGGDDSDRPYLATLSAAHALSPCRVTASDASFALGADAAGLPLLWPSGALETTLLMRAREWGASTVLSGVFADACFDGNAEAASHALVRRGPFHALAMARSYDGARAGIALRRVLWPHVRRLLPTRLRRAAHALRDAGPPFRAFDGPRLRRARARDWERERSSRKDSAIDASFFSPHLMLLAELRAQEEALSGVVRADPYLSADVVAFALSLAPDVLVADGRRRGLFREAMKGLLPEAITTRAGKASFRPLHASLIARTDERATFSALADLGIVDGAAIGPIFRHARGHGSPHDGELLSLLGMDSWLRGGAS